MIRGRHRNCERHGAGDVGRQRSDGLRSGLVGGWLEERFQDLSVAHLPEGVCRSIEVSVGLGTPFADLIVDRAAGFEVRQSNRQGRRQRRGLVASVENSLDGGTDETCLQGALSVNSTRSELARRLPSDLVEPSSNSRAPALLAQPQLGADLRVGTAGRRLPAATGPLGCLTSGSAPPQRSITRITGVRGQA